MPAGICHGMYFYQVFPFRDRYSVPYLGNKVFGMCLDGVSSFALLTRSPFCRHGMVITASRPDAPRSGLFYTEKRLTTLRDDGCGCGAARADGGGNNLLLAP